MEGGLVRGDGGMNGDRGIREEECNAMVTFDETPYYGEEIIMDLGGGLGAL